MHSRTLQSSFLIGAGVALALGTPASGASDVLRAAPAASPDAVRAVWVVRTALRSPDAVARMVESAARAGFNTILVQVRGRGEAFHRGRIEPRASDLAGQPESFDPLALAIDLGHRAGLSVHAWVNVNLVASGTTLPQSSRHIARRHPEWLMVPDALAGSLNRLDPKSPAYLDRLARWTRASSDRVEGLYLSPIVPAARDHTVQVIRELIDMYPLDGLHLDYVRYPGPGFDYSPAALAEFRKARLPATSDADRERLDRATKTNPAAWAANLPETWADFRRDRLTTLVERMASSVHEIRPGLMLSAAVVPDPEEARSTRLQDWPAWARGGLFGAFCPMMYTTDAKQFAGQLAHIRTTLPDVPIWAGVGAYRLPVERTAAHVRLARQGGAAGVALFSYERLAASGNATGVLAALRSVLLESGSSASGR